MAFYIESEDDGYDSESVEIPVPHHHVDVEAGITTDLTKGTSTDGKVSQMPTQIGAVPLEVNAFSARAYQLEMLDQSLRRNTIVVMDTGSGKTHVAVLRIMHELENSPQGQIVWFLAPTIELAFQQFNVLESQISAVQVKFLTGNDNIDKWSEKAIWDAVLEGVGIMVSTHDVLYQAMSHGFVLLDCLSLLIFDEAHHCVKKHSSSKIMRDFYHPALARGQYTPSILGLSASPIMKSKIQSLEYIEQVLHSKCVTPNRHRAELLQYVKMPELIRIPYQESPLEVAILRHIPILKSLKDILDDLDIMEDPWIINLQRENTPKARGQLNEALCSGKTNCRNQLKSLYNTAVVIARELGSSAANYYISLAISTSSKESSSWSSSLDLREEEKAYLRAALAKVSLPSTLSSDGSVPALWRVSDKVAQLIYALSAEEKLAGIVFVRQRATVAVLAQLLSLHPYTSTRFRVGKMVGSSANANQKASIAEPFDNKDQRISLDRFRNGELDLIIATSVLEEGIDVPACNLVVCFNEPENLKSFVQRRGRARKLDSKLVLLQSQKSDKLEQWQELETELKKRYADETREYQQAEMIENAKEHDGNEFRVLTTGALLNFDNALQHLYHFCATLSSNPYVSTTPEFILSPTAPAKVLLPLLVDPTLRLFSGRRVWKSQRNAKKDVAFQAYLALYKAGLVNENLMPVKGVDPDQEFLKTGVEERPGIVVASKQLDPWVEVAKAWEGVRHSQQVYSSVLTLRDGGEMTSFELVLPMPLPLIPPFHLFWSYEKTLTITISEPVAKEIDIKDLLRLQEQARMLLDATFNYRFQVPRSDLLALFLDPLYPASWQSNLCNPCPIENISELLAKGPDMGIIHQKGIPSNRFTFLSHLDALNSLPNSQSLQYGMRDEIMEASSPPYLHLKKLSNKLDFLQPVFQTRKRDLKTYILSLAECDIEQVPWRTTRFGLLIPSIMRRLGLYLLADLCRMTLPNIGISDINLLFTAIRKVQNDEGENYERFEFIGDSILKLLTSIQLLTDYPLWPEGFLSAKRDRIINNSRLSRAALHVGLDKFIVTEYWHAKKWRPPTIGEVLENESQQSNLRREISTKTLADVVEALIGAASVEGGFEKSVECLRVFLPEIDWRPMESNIEKMYESTPTNILLPATLEPLEELIDYRFKKKTLLIEAMTHASYTVGRASMERLEFLGDAVLDSIINKELYSFKGRDLSPYEMTTIKSAMSNRHFLAFMCMEWSLTRNTNNVVLDDEHPEKFTIISSATTLALWQFMRFNSVHIATSQQKTVSTYKMLRQQIRDAIAYGSHYPWVLLNQLFADKFFSDIVESLLGALFVDSGALDACHGILERMGLLGCLRCILDNGTVVLTPEVELGNFAGQQWRAKVRYVIDIEKSVERGDGSGGYSCEVFVGEKSIVVVRGGATKDESRMRAAEEALRILRLDLNVRAEPAVAD